jgi:hypothetical protein
MPITPLHYPVAWGLSKVNKKLNFPGLIVGSFIPDIEVPILILFFDGIIPDHFILHSLIGALTIGTIISTLATIYLYPIIVSLIFRVDRAKLNEVCKLTPLLVISCMLGNIFHIFLDVPMHPYNPVLWPFVDPYEIVGILVLFLAVDGNIGVGFSNANIFTNLIMGIIIVAILVRYRKNLVELVIRKNLILS